MTTRIALVGNAGVGKTTAENALGIKSYSFAGTIKTMLFRQLGVPWSSLNGSQGDKTCPLPQFGGATGREMMQKFGDAGRNCYPDFWVDRLLAILPDGEDALVSDVRYPNEAEALRRRGFKIIRITRPGVHIDTSHSSEVDQATIVVDAYVNNDSTVEDLVAKILEAYAHGQ